jgi:hypothetical protein
MSLPERLAKPVQIAEVVLLGKEAWLPVMAALHKVQGLTIAMKTRAAGHVGSLVQKIDRGPFFHVYSLPFSFLFFPLFHLYH